jgi:hypothetical protein
MRGEAEAVKKGTPCPASARPLRCREERGREGEREEEAVVLFWFTAARTEQAQAQRSKPAFMRSCPARPSPCPPANLHCISLLPLLSSSLWLHICSRLSFERNVGAHSALLLRFVARSFVSDIFGLYMNLGSVFLVRLLAPVFQVRHCDVTESCVLWYRRTWCHGLCVKKEVVHDPLLPRLRATMVFLARLQKMPE